MLTDLYGSNHNVVLRGLARITYTIQGQFGLQPAVDEGENALPRFQSAGGCPLRRPISAMWLVGDVVLEMIYSSPSIKSDCSIQSATSDFSISRFPTESLHRKLRMRFVPGMRLRPTTRNEAERCTE